jgi:hypothetical protein
MLNLIIKNDSCYFKKHLRVVHGDTLNEMKNKQYVNTDVRVDDENKQFVDVKYETKKTVRFDDNNNEYVPECPNGLTCDDFKVSEECGISNEDNIKELYDFVYEEESNKLTTGQTIQDFFPETTTFETKVDKTEIDTHRTEKSTEIINNNCNFEVIGMIETEEDVFGLDMLSSTNFSNI